MFVISIEGVRGPLILVSPSKGACFVAEETSLYKKPFATPRGTAYVTNSMQIFAPQETDPQETRAALVPEMVGRLVKLGAQVVVESGLGEKASWPDKV